jgi:16S rRNA (guanine966-N2)-methyltransferase
MFMRIISGSAGGIPIKVPKSETRPTTDRVRQAVFSMLGGEIVGARVLDLFAGSGALGLEALSRGAATALFVDHHPAACKIIHENLAKSRLVGAEVRQGEVSRVLAALARGGAQFDLVFADPPYAHARGDVDFTTQLLASEDLRAVMKPGASFVFECRVTKDGNDSWSGWQIERDREYGSTRILWLRKRGDVESAESDHL